MKSGNVAPSNSHLASQLASLDAVYRRVSWRLLPLLLLCYVLACLDRINISFAKLQMQQALGMTDAVYGLGAGVFFLGYMLFEVPSNLLLGKIGARKTISRIMVLWGLTSASMLFVHDALSFYVLRFLLGVFEAGFAPGMILYLTFWYPDTRRARVTALALMGGPIAGLIGGPLSSIIMTAMDGLHGLAGWQWLFVMEGLPCIALGIVAFFHLDDTPAQARWLSADERARLCGEVRAGEAATRHSAFGAALRDPRVYLMAISYFCLICGIYTISFWLPTMLKRAHVGDLTLGWYAALPYLLTIIFAPMIARRSDRVGERRLHSAMPALAGAVLLLCASSFDRHLAGTLTSMCAATLCIYTGYVVFWSIPTAYLKSHAAAGGIALINSIGLLGGFLSPSLIGWLKSATGSLEMGLFAMAALLFVGGLLILVTPAARPPQPSLIDSATAADA